MVEIRVAGVADIPERRELAGTGHAFREDMPVVCERFEKVFPPPPAAQPTV